MDDIRTAEDLDEETRKRIDASLNAEANLALEKIFQFDVELTKYSFLANAGGATATLAFLGARPDQATVAIWPLLAFVVGLIATGAEIRSLVPMFAARHRDAIRRRQQFSAGKLSLTEISPTVETGRPYTQINHWSGWIAQMCFAAGSVIAVAAMLWFAERQPAGREHWALIDAFVGEGLQINGIFETQSHCLMAKADYLRLIQSEVQTRSEPSGMISSKFGSLTLSCITLKEAKGLSSRMSDKRK